MGRLLPLFPQHMANLLVIHKIIRRFWGWREAGRWGTLGPRGAMAVSPPGPCLLGQLDLELKSHPETPRVRDGKNPNESPSPVRVMGTGTEPYPQGVEKSPTPPPPVTHRIDGDHMVTLDFHHCPRSEFHHYTVRPPCQCHWRPPGGKPAAFPPPPVRDPSVEA